MKNYFPYWKGKNKLIVDNGIPYTYNTMNFQAWSFSATEILEVKELMMHYDFQNIELETKEKRLFF